MDEVYFLTSSINSDRTGVVITSSNSAGLGTDNARPVDRPERASDGTQGVYGISVAAELAGMSVQGLRLYERKGLLEPARTTGGTRRYSDADVARLRRIGVLIGQGVNLNAIGQVLGLEAENSALLRANADLRSSNADLDASNSELRSSNAALAGDNAVLRRNGPRAAHRSTHG